MQSLLYYGHAMPLCIEPLKTGRAGDKTDIVLREFQKANGLTADGKVGPKTWSLLSKHLNLEQATSKAR